MAMDVAVLRARLEVDRGDFDGALQAARSGLTQVDSVAGTAAARLRQLNLPPALAAAARDADAQLGRMETSARGAGRATDSMRMGSDVERAAATARAELDRVQDAARGAGDELGDMGDSGSDAGTGFLAGFSSKIEGLGSKAGPIGTALVGVAAIGLTAGAALAAAIADGMGQKQALADLGANLGVDEATAARFGKAAGDAYAANFGESVQANMDSATAAADFGLIDSGSSAAEIESMIGKAETLNQVLGTQTQDSLRSVSALVKSGLVPDVNAAFDLMVAGRQAGMNAQGDLIDSVSEYSAGWKNSGLSAQTAMALIAQSMDAGVDNTDRGADAIREFGRRVTEEGDTMIASLNDIGVNGSEMYAAFVRGGPDAEAAFDAVFDKIRSIEDPVARNQAAMALLGDTAGDFIGAFAQWDPSKAVSDFGSVEGAAQRAADTIGGTAASSVESARRSIETSTDSIKLALAEAFGPALEDAAAWVSENRGEIIGFFTDLADAGFATLDGVLAFVSGSLRGFAMLSDGVSDMVGQNISALGTLTGFLGDVLSVIPGMEGEGEALAAIGDGMQTFSDRLSQAGDQARTAADAIDTTIRPTLAGLREDVVGAGETAANSARLMTALGDEVTAIPDGKSIVIDSNSPQQQAQLEALGLKVTSMPNGQFRIESNTADGQRVIDDFVATNNGRQIAVTVVATGREDLLGRGYTPGQAPQILDRSTIPRTERADGGIVRAYAAGGIAGALTPMSGVRADVVPPNTWRVVGDRARDDEFFIPDTDEPQHVSLGMEWARRRGLIVVDPNSLTPMADGGLGFGGYSGPDTRDYMRPTNLSEVFALASGLGFTAVSGVSNYASMAASGQWDLSKLTPQFDRSNNTIPGVDKALSAVTERLDTLIETLQQGGLVEAKFDVSNDMSARLTKAGIA